MMSKHFQFPAPHETEIHKSYHRNVPIVSNSPFIVLQRETFSAIVILCQSTFNCRSLSLTRFTAVKMGKVKSQISQVRGGDKN